MLRTKRQIPLKHQFISEILRYELKKHDWSDVEHKNTIKALIEDAYETGFDPSLIFYEFCPVEGIEEKEYGMQKTWQETMDKIAEEYNGC